MLWGYLVGAILGSQLVFDGFSVGFQLVFDGFSMGYRWILDGFSMCFGWVLGGFFNVYFDGIAQEGKGGAGAWSRHGPEKGIFQCGIQQ